MVLIDVADGLPACANSSGGMERNPERAMTIIKTRRRQGIEVSPDNQEKRGLPGGSPVPQRGPAAQKETFRKSWIWREVPVPTRVPMVLVLFPKLGSFNKPEGLEKFGWLNMLNTCAPNRKPTRSVTCVFLERPISN